MGAAADNVIKTGGAVHNTVGAGIYAYNTIKTSVPVHNTIKMGAAADNAIKTNNMTNSFYSISNSTKLNKPIEKTKPVNYKYNNYTSFNKINYFPNSFDKPAQYNNYSTPHNKPDQYKNYSNSYHNSTQYKDYSSPYSNPGQYINYPTTYYKKSYSMNKSKQSIQEINQNNYIYKQKSIDYKKTIKNNNYFKNEYINKFNDNNIYYNYNNYIQKNLKTNIDDSLMKFEDISRNPLYINLLHYDDKLTNKENQNYYKYFKLNIVGGYYGINNLIMLHEYIKEIKNSKIFLRYILLVSGSNSSQVLEKCYFDQFIEEIIIFCFKINDYTNLLSYQKIKLVTNSFKDIISFLKKDIIPRKNLICLIKFQLLL